MTSRYKPITLFLEFYYMSNGLTFEIFQYIILRNFWKCHLQKFKEIGSELKEKWTKNMRYRFTKKIVAQT